MDHYTRQAMLVTFHDCVRELKEIRQEVQPSLIVGLSQTIRNWLPLKSCEWLSILHQSFPYEMVTILDAVYDQGRFSVQGLNRHADFFQSDFQIMMYPQIKTSWDFESLYPTFSWQSGVIL